MPLLFIALFLGSFLIGAGTSYVTQGQGGGFGGGTPVATTNPNITVTPNPQACIPTVENNMQIPGSTAVSNQALIIEATRDLPANEEDNLIDRDDNPIPQTQSVNWTKILKWIFGDELLGNPRNTPANPSDETGFLLDRRKDTWTLIKRDAAIPSWKVAFQSGTMKWQIPNCVWNYTQPCDGLDPGREIAFHEMTRIGRLDLNKLPEDLRRRYQNLPNDYINDLLILEQKESIGDVWVATGWCGYDQPNPRTPGGSLNPIDSQSTCADPLIKNFIFVVSKKGYGNRLGRSHGVPRNEDPANPDPDYNPAKRNNSWWMFDVYYAFGSLPVDVNKLPCWTSTCGRCNGMFNPNLRIGDPLCQQQKNEQNCKEEQTSFLPGTRDYLVENNNIKAKNQRNIILSIKSYIKKEYKTLVSNIRNTFFIQAAIEFPQFISGKSINYRAGLTPDMKTTLETQVKPNTYILGEIVSLPNPNTVTLIGDVTGTGGNKFNVYALNTDLNTIVPTAPPTPTPNSYQGSQTIYVEYGGQTKQYTFVHRESTQGETLKLRTFYPPIVETPPPIPATFTYEWYTPACKPAIYLYPENLLELSVVVRPQGQITRSIPEHGDSGWKDILAKPNGELVFNNKSLPYLYYEAEVKNVNPPTQGWVVKKEDLSAFFETALPYLGLNQKESMDFKNYWLKKLSAKPYYFVGLIERNVLDKLENIEFSQKPDQFIRVRFYFEGLDKPIIAAPPLLPKTPQRDGFTAVDWGGMLANGTCGDTLKSE